MGQHKYREATVKVKILAFFLGTACTAVALYNLIDYPQEGIFQANGYGKLLAFGLLLIIGPLWFRKKKSVTRN